MLAACFVAASGSRIDCSFEASYPQQYVVYKTTNPPLMDGKLDEKEWREADWTRDFVDISTDVVPRFRTRAKMRYDDQYLYVGVLMEEPQIWANITETCHCANESQNQVIFHDNDFEIFVDADGDTHHYKEFEINALNASWNLALNKPYDDDGYENSTRVLGSQGWDFSPWSNASPYAPPLVTAVHVSSGKVNDPNSEAHDRWWSLEVALPLESLAHNETASVPPRHGTLWRINFSRVEWKVKAMHGKYWKVPEDQHEDNWVWSAQGAIAMHLPEHWGMLQFSTDVPGTTAARRNPEWTVRSVAMQVYYAQHAYRKARGRASKEPQSKDFDGEAQFTDNLAELRPFAEAGMQWIFDGSSNPCTLPPVLALTGGGNGFRAIVNFRPRSTESGVSVSCDHHDAGMAAVITDDRFLRVSRPMVY